MQPYNPNIINLEKFAKELRTKEERGFGTDKSDGKEIKVGTGDINKQMEVLKIEGMETIHPNCPNTDIVHQIQCWQEHEKV